MFGSKEFFMLIPCLYLGLYVFSKVADIFHPYFQKNRYQFRSYNRVVIIIMVAIVCIMATSQTLKYVFETMYARTKDNHEIYTLKSANYNIYFQDSGSANVEHILWLKRNKDISDKVENAINYEFDEIGDISNIQVFVNNNEIEKNSSKISGTFTTNLSDKTNKIHIYLPDKDEEIRLKINYYVKNSISQKGDGYGTYYNKFLTHRSGLSYNTQFKGNINFIMPKGSKCKFAGYCKDLYVKTEGNGDNIANIYFENRLPKDFFLYRGRAMTIIKKYDDFNFKGEYTKNFYTIVGVKFLSNSNLDIDKLPQLGESNYSVEELINMNEENNKKYSDFHFVITFIGEIIINGISLLLLAMIPLIRWYYKKKLNEYWKYISEEK